MSVRAANLRFFDVTMIVVSLVIGMGIFRTPVNVAQQAGSPGLFFIVWIVGGIAALCGALTYAEIGSRYPVTGGYYRIFSYCYHPSLAFAINCVILVSNAASLAGVTIIGAEYISKVVFPDIQHPDRIRLIIAAITIVVFYCANLLGLRASAYTQNVLTVIKIGLVVLLITAVFTNADSSINIELNSPVETTSWMETLNSFGICLVAVSFTYGGYQQVINFGGEVKNATQILPRGIFAGIAIIMLLYVGINYTYFKVIGFEQLKEAESVAALLAQAIFGEMGFIVLSILLFLSVLAYVNVLLMANPRVMFAMSEDGILPRIFQKRNVNTGALVPALTMFATFCFVTLFYAQTFDVILNYVIFLDSIGMATSAATIFILRKRPKNLDQKEIYKIKFYPLVPLIFIVSYLVVAVSIAFNTPLAAIISAVVFLVFFLLYFLLSRFQTTTR